MSVIGKALGKISNSIISSAGDGIANIIDSTADALTKKKQISVELERVQNELTIATQEHIENVIKEYRAEAEAEVAALKAAYEREARIHESPHATKLGRDIQSYIAIVVIGLTYLLTLVEWTCTIPPDKISSVNTTITRMWDATLVVIGYYFVSSIGSRMKDSVIGKYINKKNS